MATPQANEVKEVKSLYPFGLTKEQMLDVTKIPEDKYVTVEIPAEDVLGKPHEDITINGERYAAGATHRVNPLLAADIKDRVEQFEIQIQKLFQQNKAKHRKLIEKTSLGAGFDEDALAQQFRG